MDSPRLLSLPTELLHYLCLFLPEEDLLSLFHTCLQVHKALNTNLVWKRFVTEEVRRLKTREQQLDPPLQLHPNLCEDLQHVLRKNRLLSNWRDGRFSQYSAVHGINPKHFDWTYFQSYEVQPYKENYLITEGLKKAEVWDITKRPKIFHTMEESYIDKVVGDYLVVNKGRCRIDVYKINIEDKKFPPLYSFAIADDKVVNEIVPHAEKPCSEQCDRWEFDYVENLLVFNQRTGERHYPAVHIWDVESARNLGKFVGPTMCYYLKCYALNNNCLFFKTMDLEWRQFFLKLDLTSKNFSEATFEVEDSHVEPIFHKDYCIIMKRNDEKDKTSVRIEVFSFESSEKLITRTFEKACYNLQHKSVTDGKLIIFTPASFLVVDALSLETVSLVPHGSNVDSIMCQTSLFGSIFLVAIEKDGVVKIWDIEKRSSTLIPIDKFSESMVNEITWCFKNHCIVHGREPLTKFVIYGVKEMFVTHFW